MTTSISPPPLAELQTLSGLLALVNDPKALKKSIDGLIAATKEFHDASAQRSLEVANQEDEDNARVAELDNKLSAKQLELDKLDKALFKLKSQAAALAGE